MRSHRLANLADFEFRPLIGVALAAGAVLPLAPSLANAASVHKEVVIEAPPEFVWDALRDFGSLHTRLARGFVVDTRMDGEARIVAFANGTEVRELLVHLDDGAMRLVYAVDNDRLTAHSASAQIFPDGTSATRFVWIADFLPNEMEPYISEQMEIGIAAIKRTLEEDAAK